MHELNDLECEGARFVKNEIDRFYDSVLDGSFTADYITTTEPAIHAKYARVPAEYQAMHKRVWTTPRGQQIIDNSDPHDQWMWRTPMGYAISEHPALSLLFIWYMPHAMVIGLDGPKRDSVIAYCKSEGKVYHSRALYTDDEIDAFDKHHSKVVYFENYVNP